MRAAVYSRMSKRTYTSADTIDEQERRGEELVTSRGWEPVGTFTDDGKSAWRKNVARPAFGQLLAACERGDVDVIVVRKIDRLTRNPGDWGRLRASGVKFVEWGGSGTVLPNIVADIEASRAESESEEISNRVKWDESRRVEAGKPPRGGRRAFGYRRDHAIDPDEAAVVRELVERYLGGETLHSLCRWLHDQDVPTPSGNVWQPSVLSRTLKSPRIAGLRRHNGEVREGNWKPIISVDQHKRIVEASGGPTRRRGQVWLLSGLIWCGREGCGGRLASHLATSRHRKRYACRQTIGKSCAVGIEAHLIERHVWDAAVAEAWQRDEADQVTLQRRVADVRSELHDVEHQLQQVNTGFRNRDVSYDLWVEMTRAFEDDAAALRARLRDLEAHERAVPEWWKLLALDDADDEEATDRRRQQAIRAVVRRVTVHPSPVRGRFDPDRVEIEWR